MVVIAFPFFWMSSYAQFYSTNERGDTVLPLLDLGILIPVFLVAAVLSVMVIFSSHIGVTLGGLAGIALLMWLGTLYFRWRHQRCDLSGIRFRGTLGI